MKLLRNLSILMALIASASSAETAFYDYFKMTGQIQSIYIRSPDVFIVKVKSISDGAYYQAWMKGNSQALATLLTEKASGHNVNVIYSHMANSTDNNLNCYDVPYVVWVCNRANWVETIE